jgi:hypothetical protein
MSQFVAAAMRLCKPSRTELRALFFWLGWCHSFSGFKHKVQRLERSRGAIANLQKDNP